jgi:16S rRNA (cytosine967-C5)-methyltransferase
MKISPARLAAFEILRRIETERAFSSVLLPAFEDELAEIDRGLCHELVLGVLRRQIYLDRIIEQLAGQKKLDVEVRIILRLGIYQLLFLDRIPAYSAVNESVSLVQKARKTSAKGLVNAILRRVSERPPHVEFADDIERITVETSHPRWLIKKWIVDLGPVAAGELAAANNVAPRISFRLTATGKVGARLATFERSPFVEGCYFARSIDAPLRQMAAAGEIYFQDEASQLVALAVSQNPGGRVLDVCAAPGGKTTQVAAEAARSGDPKFIVAGDLYAPRVNLLRDACYKQGVDFVNVVRYDASALPFPDESFDTVLVDAPCSGTGTIAHNPEIRYFLQPDDTEQISRKQLVILRNASKVVRRGGRLIYSTCSLEPEENEAVCREFLNETASFRQVPPDVPHRFLTGDGFARTFPHRDQMDGFFIAAFERHAS